MLACVRTYVHTVLVPYNIMCIYRVHRTVEDFDFLRTEPFNYIDDSCHQIEMLLQKDEGRQFVLQLL